MRLTIDPKRLQPDLLHEALAALVPDEGFRRVVEESEETPGPSAEMEAPVVEHWARRIEWGRVDVVVALGLGSGLIVDLVRNRSRAHLVVLEPRPGLVKAVLKARPLHQQQVTIRHQVIGVRADLRRLCVRGSKVMLFAPPWARHDLPEEAAQVEQTIQDAHQTVTIQHNTMRLNGNRFNDLVLDALPRAAGAVAINALEGALDGIPGIVVSAGPSLDRNVALLKELEGYGAICALNSSLSALDANHVQADLLTMLEVQNITAMMKSSPSAKNLVLVPALQTHLGVYDLPRRALMPAIMGMNGADRWLAATMGYKGFVVGGSVACLAFSLLVHLGCDPVILVGQDCALKEDRMYAQGTPLADVRYETHPSGALRASSREPFLRLLDQKERAEQHQEAPWLNRITLPAWGGQGEVRSTGPLECYRSWFEEQAPRASRQTRLINATEGGAHIPGYEELSLRQVLDELPRKPVDVVERLIARAEQEKGLDALAIAEALRHEASLCQLNAHRAKAASRCIGKILPTVGPGRTPRKGNAQSRQRELSRLERLERDIREAQQKSMLLEAYVTMTMQRIRLEAVNMTPASPEEGTRQSLEQSREIFNEISTTAAALQPKLEELAATLDEQGRSQ